MKNSTYKVRRKDRLHGEEVTGEHPLGLRTKELRPGRPVPSRSGAEAVSPQQSPDRRRSHPDAEAPELALDPDAAPARVLPGQPKNQLPDLVGKRRPPRASGPERPLAPDQLAVPTKQGGVTRNELQRSRGSTRAAAASRTRSSRRSLGRRVLRESTFN
jgi:hypothetical protein